MQNTIEKRFKPDDVITALLFYLPDELNNDAEKIHTMMYELKKEGKYDELIGDLEFVQYSRFHYSPMLDRIFNRLQESRLLASRNPDYIKYQIKDESRAAIKSYYLGKGKMLHEQRNKLEKIAARLMEEL